MGFFNNLFGEPEVVKSANAVTEVQSLKFEGSFCTTYALSMYSKIMHECAMRAMIPDGIDKQGYTITVHDGYSPYKRGLVSIITAAMVANDHIFVEKVRLDNDVYLFNRVDKKDAYNGAEIRPDVIELDFSEFHEAKVICLLFTLLQNVMNTLSKNVTISGAMLIKIHALSEMIANTQNTQPLV